MSYPERCIPGGLKLDFFPPDILDKYHAHDSKEYAPIMVRKVLSALMMGWPRQGVGDLASWTFFRTVFIERDPHILRDMRCAFQEAFHHIYAQLKSKKLTASEQAQAELYLSNCLSILPFSDITPYEFIEIPQYVDGEWILVDYKVVPIELTPTDGFEKLFIEENDRVFAYGLEPIQETQAKPHLIFMGTTYPAGQGLATQLHTDLEGFETAGKKLYRTGRDRIVAWLNKQSQKPHVCGTSLGGSLSLLLTIDQGDKLSRVDALNPFGLYNAWRKSRYDNWDKLCDEHKAPPVYIQKQGDDPVSAYGVWKKEWQIFHVQPPKNKQGPNGVIDHALNYAGFDETEFLPVDAEADNRARQWCDYLGYVLFRSMIYYATMLAYRYCIRPVFRYLQHHLLESALVAGALFVSPHCSVLVSTVVMGLMACMVAYTLFNSLVNAVYIYSGTTPVNAPACHDKNAPRNEAFDIDKNKTTAYFTVKELDAYRHANQSLFFKSDKMQLSGVSQQEVLDKCSDPAFAEELIEVTASKSDIYHMKRLV
ncbi:MAG: hypothetical protein P1U61_03245 [Legionellaceae bacterium]|nr:hypothetical protein [Legionellaceae bacterium]